MSKRVRRRYLALKIVSAHAVNERALWEAVWGAILTLFGEYGASQVDLKLVKYDPQRNFGVVCSSHKALERVRASIASITAINGKTAAIHVLRVSGTLKALLKKL